MQVLSEPGKSIETPFDDVAPEYDDAFTASLLGGWLRDLVWHHSKTAFNPGDHVLEVGCGTGEDAIWLARRGIEVTATDASTQMLAWARDKASAAGLAGRINFLHWDLSISDPSKLASRPAKGYTGLFSNFGALNCLSDRRTLAKVLGGILPSGSQAVFVLMGPWCLWEIAWHLVHGQPSTAFRRLRQGAPAHLGGGSTIQVWYPTPARLRREFSPYFRPVKLIAIGAFLPPSYLHHLVRRFPNLFTYAKIMELKLGHLFPWNWLNDHYMMIMEKR